MDALSGLAQGAGGAKKVEVHTVLEQLHWLVRIAGHVLADEGEGEVPCIPEQISIISHEAGIASGGDTQNDPVDPLLHHNSALILDSVCDGLQTMKGTSRRLQIQLDDLHTHS